MYKEALLFFFSVLNVVYTEANCNRFENQELLRFFVLSLQLDLTNILTWVFILMAPMDGIS